MSIRENKGNIAKSTALLVMMAVCFKMIGFLKQAVIAYYYGATIMTDAYFVAYGLINGISETIIRSLSVAIVSLYSATLVSKGKEASDRLISALLEILFPYVCILIGVICILAPGLAGVLAPTYSGDERTLLIKYLYIMSPILMFSVLELILNAILDSHKKFMIPRIKSLVLSVVFIGMSVLFSETLGVKSLILAQYMTSAIFVIIMIISVRKIYTPGFVRTKDVPEVKNVLLMVIPLFIGNGLFWVNKMVDRTLASGLSEGAVSALSYCNILEELVSTVLISNLANVMFAYFAEDVAKKEYTVIESTLKKMINYIVMLLLPIMIITAVFSEDIVTIVYYRGSFSKEAVIMTSQALIGYALAFPFAGVRELLLKSCYAFSDAKRPMYAGMCAIAVNIICSIILSQRMGILGITVATAISAVVSVFLNVLIFRKHIPEYNYRYHVKTILKLIPGAVCLGAVCVLTRQWLEINLLVRFCGVTLVGMLLYALMAYVCKVEEIGQVITLGSKLLKKKLGK